VTPGLRDIAAGADVSTGTARAEAEAPRGILSKYPGRCGRCRQPFAVGTDRIERADRTQPWVHVRACEPAAPEPAVDGIVSKYPGRCGACRVRFEVGADRIWRQHATGPNRRTGPWVHVKCPPPPPAEEGDRFGWAPADIQTHRAQQGAREELPDEIPF
jgi:hypothetical protein